MRKSDCDGLYCRLPRLVALGPGIQGRSLKLNEKGLIERE